MKKILVYSLIITLLLTGCGSKKEKKTVNEDAIKFKEEYESLNNNENYLEVSIKENNPIAYTSLDEIANIMDNKSGLIYLGYPESNSCRDSLPILLEAVKQTGLKKIYYLNVKDISSDEKSEEQLNKLKEYVNNFDGINVMFVKDIENIGTISSLDEDYYKPMTDGEKDELLKIYKNSIHEMLNDLCDQSC